MKDARKPKVVFFNLQFTPAKKRRLKEIAKIHNRNPSNQIAHWIDSESKKLGLELAA